MFDFPTNPVSGTVVMVPDGSYRVWDNTKWRAAPSSSTITTGPFLPIAGGVMTGALSMFGNATSALHAVPLQQLTAATAGGPFLPLATGGTIAGPVTVSANNGVFAGDAYAGMRQGSGHLTWVGQTDLMLYFDTRSLAAFYNPDGRIGVVAASRSSDNVDGSATIAFGAFTTSDDTAPNSPGTWGYYGTARRVAGGSTAICMEVDMGNMGDTVPLNPYQTGTYGSTIGLWIGAGSEAAQFGSIINPASVAIGIVSSGVSYTPGATWAKGIVFGTNALTLDTWGHQIALSLAQAQEIHWAFGGSDARAAFIRSDATTVGVGIIFDNNGFNLTSAVHGAETPLFKIATDGGLHTYNTLVPDSGTQNIRGGLSLAPLGSAIPAGPAAINTVVQAVGTTASATATLMDAFASNPVYAGRRANGTAASPTAIATDDVILSLSAYGYGGGAYTTTGRASIAAYGAEAWTGTAQGTYWSFQTTQPGTASRTEKMRLTGGGNLLVGTTTDDATNLLQVNGPINVAAVKLGAAGPNWTHGTGAPGTARPNGSIYSRDDGTAGARFYVSNGTTWTAVATV